MKTIPVTLCAALVAAALPASAQTVIPVPYFKSLELEGGGHVTLRYGKVQSVRLVKGSTQFTPFVMSESRKLRILACNEDCPRHYDLEVEVTTPDIDALAVSGGGHIEGDGNFPGQRQLALAVDGGGTIDARAMPSQEAIAAVEGGGKIFVDAERKLTAAINGGGKIRYRGEPNLTQAIDGGGSVERGD
ncbi:MAG TPA: DUF2807 domain-containing protein [Rhizomicrobium sp.]|jgi:hypothetical protein